jgi:hypothetical protein
MRTLVTIASVLTLAACAGPTAKTSDREVCLGMLKGKTISEMMSYADAAVKRGLECDGDYTKDLTEQEKNTLEKNGMILYERYKHLHK